MASGKELRWGDRLFSFSFLAVTHYRHEVGTEDEARNEPSLLVLFHVRLIAACGSGRQAWVLTRATPFFFFFNPTLNPSWSHVLVQGHQEEWGKLQLKHLSILVPGLCSRPSSVVGQPPAGTSVLLGLRPSREVSQPPAGISVHLYPRSLSEAVKRSGPTSSRNVRPSLSEAVKRSRPNWSGKVCPSWPQDFGPLLLAARPSGSPGGKARPSGWRTAWQAAGPGGGGAEPGGAGQVPFPPRGRRTAQARVRAEPPHPRPGRPRPSRSRCCIPSPFPPRLHHVCGRRLRQPAAEIQAGVSGRAER